METNPLKKQKLEAVIARLDKAIASNGKLSKDTIGALEMMNIPNNDFTTCSEILMLSAFVGAYLARIKEVAEAGDLKNAESVIRFHAYQLHTKTDLSEDGIVARSQFAMAKILDNIIVKFFDC